MKVLHAAMMPNYLAGVMHQMEWEALAAKDEGLNHEVVLFCPSHFEADNSFIKKIALPKNKILAYLKIRLQFHLWIIKNAGRFDVVLLRYTTANLIQALFSFRWKNIVTVHHSKEEQEIKSDKSRLSHLHAFAESICAKITFQHVQGIVAVTPEIARYEGARMPKQKKLMTHIIYPNGIFLDPGVDIKNKTSDTKNILFVSSFFSNWQGLDLLVASITAYTGNTKFKLHIVGEIDDNLITELTDDNRYVLHGSRNTKYTAELYNICGLGLSSFGLFRKNMASACTLKVREYLAHGIPVYAGHRDSGLPNNFRFFKQGEADIGAILNFYEKVKSIKPNEVRQTSAPYISKLALLNKLHTDLASRLNTTLSKEVSDIT